MHFYMGPAEWEEQILPPARFSRLAKKAVDIGAKRSVPYLTSIWHITAKFRKNVNFFTDVLLKPDFSKTWMAITHLNNTHLTILWPCYQLSIKAMLICYLLHPLGNLIAKFGSAAAALFQELIRRKVTNLANNLTLHWLVTLKKSWFESTRWELSIFTLPASLRPPARGIG